MCFGIFICLTVYSAFVLPYILHVKEDIDKYAPNVVYFGAFVGVIYFIS